MKNNSQIKRSFKLCDENYFFQWIYCSFYIPKVTYLKINKNFNFKKVLYQLFYTQPIEFCMSLCIF